MARTCRSRELERAFERICTERMADIPLLNRALRVEALGFRPWQGQCLGVLITPRFMNLVLLPAQAIEGPPRPTGGIRTHRFPAGDFEFICSHEPGLGDYQSCSLFSPMCGFKDQEAAVETASAALEALFQLPGTTDVRKGDTATGHVSAPPHPPAPSSGTWMDRPLSRRDLLRGRLAGRRTVP